MVLAAWFKQIANLPTSDTIKSSAFAMALMEYGRSIRIPSHLLKHIKHN